MKIVIANLKGGTCKTTTALFLAQAAVLRGIPTVVWDADVQASASDWAYGCQQKGAPLPFEVVPANASTVCRDDPLGRPIGKLYEYADVMAELACGMDLPARQQVA